MFRIRKKYTFEMAHQLTKAFSTSCSDCIHGHTYDLELYFVSEKLDDTGMVVDFGQISSVIKEYVNSWDHALVMHKLADSTYLHYLSLNNSKMIILDVNPTAESMAEIMFNEMNKRFNSELPDRNFALEKVRLHETRTGYAEYEPVVVE